MLGRPGSGKTTTTLMLAKYLTEEAINKPNHPIPVILTLSTNQKAHISFEEWIFKEMKAKYGMSRGASRTLFLEQKLLFIFDGLDEVKSDLQGQCVDGINDLIEHDSAPQHLIVCSRVEEYEALVNSNHKLCLNNAILLKALSGGELKNYLSSIGAQSLLEKLDFDQDIARFACNPLYLNFLTSVHEEISWTLLRSMRSPREKILYVFESYVNKGLSNSINKDLNKSIRRSLNRKRFFLGKRAATFELKRTKYWLKQIAIYMKSESQTEFLIENIQPDILQRKEVAPYYFITDLPTLLLSTFTSTLFVFCILVYFFDAQPMCSQLPTGCVWITKIRIPIYLELKTLMATCIAFSFWSWYESIKYKINVQKHDEYEAIETMGKIVWSWEEYRSEAIPFAFTGSILFILVAWMWKWPIALLVLQTFFVCLIILVINISAGFVVENTSRETIPNQGVRNRVRYIFSFWISGGIIGVAIYLLFLLSSVSTYFILNEDVFLRVANSFDSYMEWSFRNISDPVYLERLERMGSLTGWYDQFKRQSIESKVLNCIIFLFASFFLGMYSAFIKDVVALDRNSARKAQARRVNLRPLIQYFSLRLFIYKSRIGPWNYSRFLDFCTDSLILQRVGGRYQFMHRFLRDYFASVNIRH